MTLKLFIRAADISIHLVIRISSFYEVQIGYHESIVLDRSGESASYDNVVVFTIEKV